MLHPLASPVHSPIPLGPEDESALAEAFKRTLDYRRRSRLVRQGEPSHEVKVIRQGIAIRSKSNADGGRQIVGFVTSGQICDLGMLFFKGGNSDVETVIDCEVAIAKKADLLDIVEARPGVAKALLATALAGEAIAQEWVLNVGRRSARQRLAHLLCEVVACSKDFDRKYTCSFPMTQEMLADATGLSIVQVNRSLQELRAASLVTLEHRVLIVHDWEALCALAGFDPSYLH